MKDMNIVDFGDFKITVSSINGLVISVPADLEEKELKQLIEENGLYKEPVLQKELVNEELKQVYISIHSSSKCNLNCSYCFMKDRKNPDLTLEEMKRFIDVIIKMHPHAEKFIMDPTGSGEPLLRVNDLVELAAYCRKKSNHINREILLLVATNGMLLSKENIKKLQDSGYIFGVSMDGPKAFHDAYRVDFSGKGSFKQVLKNVKQIEHKQYIGAAVTITNENKDYVKTLKYLLKYFPTVSMKPVRSLTGEHGLTEENIEDYKARYTKLFDFILSETRKGNLQYVSAMINGDDYFGKFITRAILGQRVITRCDAGISRFSLGPDRKIYVCPGAVDIEDLVIGDLEHGIDPKKQIQFFDILTNQPQCKTCIAKFVCAGECMVNSYYVTGQLDSYDPVMCNLKQHLYKLALLYNELIVTTPYHNALYLASREKGKRMEMDQDLDFVLNHTDYSFLDLKDIKDNHYEKYEEIRKNINK